MGSLLPHTTTILRALMMALTTCASFAEGSEGERTNGGTDGEEELAARGRNTVIEEDGRGYEPSWTSPQVLDMKC
jgi:hypothetical protein